MRAWIGTDRQAIEQAQARVQAMEQRARRGGRAARAPRTAVTETFPFARFMCQLALTAARTVGWRAVACVTRAARPRIFRG